MHQGSHPWKINYRQEQETGGALIVLSSLAGAFVIVSSMGLDHPFGTAGFIVLALVGMGVQAVLFLKSGKRNRP